MMEFVRKHFAAVFVVGLLLTLAGCSDADESNPSDVNGYNYTDYYIAGFRVGNEAQGLWAGGPNIFPKRHGESRSGGGGGMCCISIPSKWRPDMKLVVKWKVDKIQDGKTPGKWYTATTDVPPYGPRTYGFWVHFLPGDRIRIEIQDKPPMPVKPGERDPYIVQGFLDPELNKK
ncbi:DUF3304 domain-containing protein [Burkholderia ambifaria]|jgi:hypothetical protein|uniref:DUF3304 domain-containing protein n=1 Tax=Burkholderia ambifaria IOP40-10 TaxID=396596 RepID=B1FA86_9BURK|nr:DUF3304 domain-containing protein [Burkholderia ambifaria]EDT05541.1 conserved hypothetical protein [Burkholderia ambifaria IOP40-10]